MKMQRKNKKLTRIFAIVISVLFLLSCNKNTNRKPDFFRMQDEKFAKSDDFSVFYINTDSIVFLKDDKVGYFIKSLLFYDEVRSTEGAVYMNGNCIYLNLKDASNDIKLFDFNLSLNYCDTINYSLISRNKLSVINKTFKLCLMDKFFDLKKSDTIYQFKLENFGVYFKDDDIVLFVGKNIGLEGFYLGDRILQKKTEEFIDIYYDFRGNIYQERPYFTKLVKKKLL